MGLVSVLRKVELFEGLNEEELLQIGEYCQNRRFEKGELVAKQGELGTELFIIEEGFVEVILGADNENRNVIVNLGTGQTIGEMSMVDQGPRSASVRAISNPTLVQIISHADFEKMCKSNTQIGYTIMKNIAADISFKLRQRHMSSRRD